jgi:hypothetical protein
MQYPSNDPEKWLDQARTRIQLLADRETLKTVMVDLQRWLPSHFPINEESTRIMLSAASESLQHGIETMALVGSSRNCTRQHLQGPRS